MARHVRVNKVCLLRPKLLVDDRVAPPPIRLVYTSLRLTSVCDGNPVGLKTTVEMALT